MSILDSFRLDGTVVLVTGAGGGLGAVAAAALAEAGATVVVSGRSLDRIETVAEKIRATGGQAVAVVVDVSSEESVITGMAAIGDRYGGIDILVNNAAVEHQAPALDTELVDFERTLRTNLIGSFLCARTFGRLAPRRPDRAIVNVASLIAERGVKKQVAYGASKSGVVSLTRTLALELARVGIRVNALCPGYFATDMPAAVLADTDQRQRLLRKIPLRRVGQPDEIGPAVVFLAAPASRYMTGSTVYFDGGFTA